jgi:hypothetical protein
MSKKQYGGKLDCGISDDAPSILLLGHGCEDTNKIINIPEGIVYVTKAICGQSSTTELLYHEFVGDFFKNTPFFNSPCKNYFLSKQYNSLDETDYHSLLNFHYKNSPVESGRTYPEFRFTPLTSFEQKNIWYSYKSGIYINKNDNSSYSTFPVVTLFKKHNKFVINEEQIRKLYEGSIFPNVDVIIMRLKEIKKSTSSDEPEGEYNTNHLKQVLDSMYILLTNLIDLIKQYYSLREAIIFNPLCRRPCSRSTVTHTDIMRRRADSLVTINTHDILDTKTADHDDDDDISKYLGGKYNRIKAQKTKQRKRKIQKKTKQNKTKKNKRRENK